MWLICSELDMSIAAAAVPGLRWSVCTILRWGLFLLIIKLPTLKLILYVGCMDWSTSVSRTEALIATTLVHASLDLNCRLARIDGAPTITFL